MAQKTVLRYEDLTHSQRKRLATQLVLRSLVVAVLLFVAFYTLPMNRPERGGVIVLVVGVLVLALVLTWQIRAIMGSPFPRLRAFEALTIGVPLLLIVFASAYYMVQNADADSFSAPLGKTDALYYTITVFSTVGFGDITAKSELARILVSIQMMFDLVVFGLVAKLIFGAVEIGLKKQRSGDATTGDSTTTPDAGPAAS